MHRVRAPEATGEAGQIDEVFGREQRQRRASFARARRALREVIEERGRIGIAAVDLVPEPRQRARAQVACDQRRLAGTGRRREPDRAPLPLAVEAGEQPLAGERAEYLGGAQLG